MKKIARIISMRRSVNSFFFNESGKEKSKRFFSLAFLIRSLSTFSFRIYKTDPIPILKVQNRT